jgi:hypothetical protein
VKIVQCAASLHITKHKKKEEKIKEKAGILMRLENYNKL